MTAVCIADFSSPWRKNNNYPIEMKNKYPLEIRRRKTSPVEINRITQYVQNNKNHPVQKIIACRNFFFKFPHEL
jgi:hypothetical protein